MTLIRMDGRDPLQWRSKPEARRIGRFRLHMDLMSTVDSVEWPMISEIMGSLFITRCELRYDTQCFEYVAVSPHFRKVDHGAPVPLYLVMYDNETHRISWKEVEEEHV